MSNVNLKRLVDTLRNGTNIYTPLIEAIVNAIQAIEEKGEELGSVNVKIMRSQQADLEGYQPEIIGFEINDNGIGFNEDNLISFDELFSEHKFEKGGKGFGRITWLKYFDEVKIESYFVENDKFYRRQFSVGVNNELVSNKEKFEIDSNEIRTGTSVLLNKIKRVKYPEKSLEAISRHIFEKILPFFVTEKYNCPKIVISEFDNSDEKILNNYALSGKNAGVEEVPCAESSFCLGVGENSKYFTLRIFKLFSSKVKSSKISLVANKREVTETSLSEYIPEFTEEFFEIGDGSNPSRNYIVKAYVFGDYLDENVSVERGGFNFDAENTLFQSISIKEIEKRVAEIVENSIKSEIQTRRERKIRAVEKWVEAEAVWHRNLIKDIDYSSLPMRPTNEQIESFLQDEKYKIERRAKVELRRILEDENGEDIELKVNKVVEAISSTSKNDLIHYVSLRKCILDLLEKFLQRDEKGKYKAEAALHEIIYPMGRDDINTNYEEHNLWILDERLNYASYLASDKKIVPSGEPDVIAFHKPYLYRTENEPSNPVTIFEFKKPQRSDFANPSSEEDPIGQLMRYFDDVREGKILTKNGRNIKIADNTIFYGYIVCDLSEKFNKKLKSPYDFTQMPDGEGWFKWFGQTNMYMEVISWDKLLKDAKIRNAKFFEKLGLPISKS